MFSPDRGNEAKARGTAGGDSDEGRSRTLLEPNFAAIDFYTTLAPRWGR
jgi:hypothetical protein